MSYPKRYISENVSKHGIEAFTLIDIFGTNRSITIPQKTNKLLLLFIRIFGCVDIVMLSAYIAVCIYDRRGKDEIVDFVSPGLNCPGRSAMYENIEIGLFSTAGINWTTVVFGEKRLNS